MSGPASNPQWYLARDGEQFGPISELEMAKLVELGHLKPTDLLWREGFPDWRPAMVVFPPSAPPSPSGPRLTRRDAGDRPRMLADPAFANPRADDRSGRMPAGARGYAADPHAGYVPDSRIGYAGAEEPPEPRRWGRRLGLLVLVAMLLAAAAAGYHTYREEVIQLVASVSTSATSTMSSPTEAVTEMAIAEHGSLEVPPFAGFRGDAATIDATLQAAALWRIVKREFPDWYQQRLEETAALASDGKEDAVIGQLIAHKLVELRRQHAAEALSATPGTLRTVALAYLNTVSRLASKSAEACHGFIVQGEAAPLVVAMLQGSEHTRHLHAGLVAVFKAIAEGRELPRVHARPTREQRDMLTAALAKKGWTGADFQILANDRAMAEAPADKVCQLVFDFFDAQATLPDVDAQTRLLVNSVRPIFVVGH